jgi:hypothetical protein
MVLAGDVAAVKRALGRVSSPAILVGRSYGGAVITAAGQMTALPGSFTSPQSLQTPARQWRVS